jgi:hypothetical protein
MRSVLRLLAVVCVAGWASGPAWAAHRAQIKDEAHLYTKEGKATALKVARQIAEKFDLDVVVETLDPLPEKERKALPHINRKKLHEKLLARTRERAKKERIDGLYAVIYTDPRDTCVVVWPEERGEQLTRADLEDVRKQLAGRRRSLLARWSEGDAGDHDRALLAGLERLQSILEHPPRRPAVDLGTVAVLILPFVGIWLLLLLIRARQNAAQRAEVGEQPAPSPSAAPVLLGAMFGVPAAQRVYDELLEGNPAAPPVGSLLTAPPPVEALEDRIGEGEELPQPPADENAPHSPVV